MPPKAYQTDPAMKKFFKFLKRLIPDKQGLPQDKEYQRDFDRYPIEFEVSISFVDNNEEKIKDRAALSDISGSGAMIITRNPEKYYPGQILKLTIFLAGTEEVSACMHGDATVVRIHELNFDDENNNIQKKGIAVKFNESFDFKRTGN